MDAFLSYPRPKPAVPQEPVPLTKELDIHVPLTPEADEAEMAAWALLELQRNPGTAAAKSAAKPVATKREQSVEYYRDVARRKREAEQAARRALMRCLAYVEQQLEHDHSEDVLELEHHLFRHQQTAEREGGTLFSRWQHCLALVTVRLMGVTGEEEDGDAPAAP